MRDETDLSDVVNAIERVEHTLDSMIVASRTELLARMAAELAAPLIARNRERRSFETEDDVCDGIANTAVDIARRILARCEAP